VRQWPDEHAGQDDVMLALHARRSAEAVLAWHTQRGACGLGLALTGTDLYRDIEHDTTAQRSLALASSLVVLNPLGLWALPAPHRDRARVILQSTTARQVLSKSARRLRAVMVGVDLPRRPGAVRAPASPMCPTRTAV
jgi:hypothetical protein